MAKVNHSGRNSKSKFEPKSLATSVARTFVSTVPTSRSPFKGLLILAKKLGPSPKFFRSTSPKMVRYSCDIAGEVGRQLTQSNRLIVHAHVSVPRQTPLVERQTDALSAYKAARAAVSARLAEPHKAKRRVLATASDFTTVTPQMQEEREAAARQRYDVIDHAIVKL